MSAEGRVEHQKLNQTAALLSFGWVFGVQLGSPVNKCPLWWSISCRRRWSGPRRSYSYFKYDKAFFFSYSNQFKKHARLLLTIISNFFHILENLYHIALYHIFEFSKSLSYCKLSDSQKVYHIQFIIFNMIKSTFIHIFAIW